MEPCADTECVIQVSVECEACKGQMNELLSSINGLYRISGDIDKGLVKFEGQVDPNIILKALPRHKDHAKIVSFKINHVKLHQGIRLPYRYGFFGYGFEHGPTMVPPTNHQPIFGPGSGSGPWPSAMPRHEPYLNHQHYPQYQQPTFGLGLGPWPWPLPGHEPYLNHQHYPQCQQHSFPLRYPMTRNSFSRNPNHHFRHNGPSGILYGENYHFDPPFYGSYY